MSDLNDIKVFTLEEAEALLPHLSVLLNRLRTTAHEIRTLEVEIDLEELLQEDGDTSKVDSRVEVYNRKVAEFNEGADQVHAPGCFLKDVENGLIDFYSVREGKGVYLCWKLGEDRIRFWHEVNKGFGSREEL